FKKDVAWVLSFLGESIGAGQPELFVEFVSWLRNFLSSLHVPITDVAESFQLIKKRLGESITPVEYEVVSNLLDMGVKVLLAPDERISLPAAGNNLSSFADRYLAHLLKGERNQAFEMVLKEVQGGMPVKEVYLQVFQPVQYEIGRLWQSNRITVAQEHLCTAATQLLMSRLYPFMFTGERNNRKMVATCVPGELHEMGARMVADFFEMEGWDTYYLGANMPIDGVVRYLVETKPLFLAISATMTFHISQVEEMIKKIRAESLIPANLKIMVGGYPFNIAVNLWKELGADGYAPGASEALQVAGKLLTS
ncbi:MAG: cobalamin-dependent protein, partial [Bacteroidota bacterium]